MEHLAEQPATPAAGWSRRRFLQAGATTAVGAAVLAACGAKHNPTSRIGTVPPTTALPSAEVNDVVLLRTTTSLEYLLLSVYDTVLEQNLLSGPHAAVAAKMRAQHEENTERLAELTEDAGGEVYACPNERMTALYIEPAMQYILGSAKAAEVLGIEAPATEIPPSPDPASDTLVLLNALEVITAATFQAYVAMLNSIELRHAGMEIGIGSSRRGALWGALITPDELVDANVAAVAPADDAAEVPADGGATPGQSEVGGDAEADAASEATPVPVVHAVSASFGQLGPVLIELGAFDENGIRQKVNIETPYLNSMAYEYMSCDA